ncbi:hypothetical protein SAMN05421678_101447 [Actinopolymorpha cephalotaxi]|uniref:Uncharacterized protein n=1 Tax=Actinopolymorpha cephalotaxi TaxID=504797 RepID=A0A1I2KVW4_9ACTN|nr:hypothetical protein SAMN05421678_101447 [Actinopolymorpha cephalotaxi]
MVRACLAATGVYFGWTGWYNAQWKYRWYPLFTIVALVLTFSTLYIVRPETLRGDSSQRNA